MTVQYWCWDIGLSLFAVSIQIAITKVLETRQLAVNLGGSYSTAMKPARPIIALLVVLIIVEVSLFTLGSSSPLSTINQSVIVGFLFGFPTLLIGGLLVIRQQWIAMILVMYSTIALALDLATIVQESSQSSPHLAVLILTALSSLINFLIMAFGGHYALGFRPDIQPPEGRHPSLQSPASS